MRVLLRDLNTGLYIGRNNVWVCTPEEAENFGTIEAGGGQATKCPEKDLAVILHYDNPMCQLALNPDYCTASFAAARDVVKVETATMSRPNVLGMWWRRSREQ